MKHNCRRKADAFTVIELLAVLAVVALIVAVRLPSLASAGLRAQQAVCRNNVRQIALGSAAYASEYEGMLMPVWIDPTTLNGAHGFNSFQEEHYGRYAYFPSPSDPAPPFKLKKVMSPYFQNLGYLYPMNLIGDGAAMFCPAFDARPASALGFGRSFYFPPLTTDPAGVVRSSYVWNPWASGSSDSSGRYNRYYPRLTDFKTPHIEQMEWLVNSEAATTSPLDDTVAHDLTRTMTTLISDGSVRTLKITPKTWAFAWAGAGANLFNEGTFSLHSVLTNLESQLNQ